MIELLSTAEMAEADRLTIAAGIAGIALMENAGQAVADGVASRHPAGTRVAIVAGPGNNGGDGFVAARLLAERGYRVRLLLAGDRARLKGDAALAAQRWSGPCEAATPSALMPAEIVVDALFGAGLDRPVEGVARAMIEAMNAAPRVLAVDLPSGINGTTGAVMGVAVRAAETVTFFRRKIGHVLLPGRLHCGTIGVADIGIGADVLARIKPRCWVNDPQLWGDELPGAARRRDTNTDAATPSWSRAGCPRPARPGWRRAARCARARASSPSPHRATRCWSTRRKTSR